MSGEYYLGQSEWAATRLRLQHELTKSNLDGHILDPSIPPVKQPMTVADVGCGTGVWAMDIADAAPELVYAEGLDINLEEVPPQAWLPNNVSFHRFNVLEELPEDFVEKYDIINMQFASSFTRDPHIKGVMANLVDMLKPGGCLQVTDSDIRRWSWMTAMGDPKPPETIRLQQLIGQIFGGFHQWEWLENIEMTFEEAGLQCICSKRVKAKPSTRQPNMMNWMLTNLEAGQALSSRTTTKKHADTLLEQRAKVMKETKELRIGMDWAVTRCVGWKPRK